MRAGIIRPCLAGARFCAATLGSFALWTVWLGLCLVLALQVYVATVREMQVPRFLLRAIEDHLAESGISVKFGRATFDPTGRVLLERARFRLASFAEPVVTADSIYIRLDPWALFERRFEAREIRATGANLFIPAMLSPSGRAERMIQDLDGGFSITSRGDEFSVDYLNFRLGGVSVSAHGTINAGTVARDHAPAKASLPLAEFVSRNYVALSREFSKALEQMSGLEHGTLTAVLTPSDTRGAVVYAELGADSLSVPAKVAVEAAGIRASTRFPLLGGAPLMTSALATAETLRIGGKVAIQGVRVRTRGVLQVDTLSFSPKEVEATAGSVSEGSILVLAPIATVEPRSEGVFSATAKAWVQGGALEASGLVNPGEGSADLAFNGLVEPAVEDVLAERTGKDIRRFVDLSKPTAVDGRVSLGPGWKFKGVVSRVDVRSAVAYHVAVDEARGVIHLGGGRLLAEDAYVRVGADHAHGSYEQDFGTLDFRYLLSGALRPMDISPWIPGDWWRAIFRNFEFPEAPAEASVDVQGRYVRSRVFGVFVQMRAEKPWLLGVPFDGARTLLWVDQWACDGLEVDLSKAGGQAQGSFRLSTEAETGRWTGFDIDVTSGLDPAPFARLLPAEAAAAIGALSFAQPPSIYAVGHFDGPAAPAPRHSTLHLDVLTGSELRAHGVALEKASFKVDVHDGDAEVSEIQAGFAGGTLQASAQLQGSGERRRLRFKATLGGASLGSAAAAGAGYVVSKKQGSATALETFARDKSGVVLDLNISAEGRPGDLASFSGEGSFQVQGSQLGELSLLGGLSKFLRFPELRFTQAKADFKVEDASIVFPELSVLGANSAIKAKGAYAIDRHQLDFTATVYPFQESHSLLQVFNVVSSPISAVLRVRLSGSVDKPSWNLAYSPLNLLRDSDLKAPAQPARQPAQSAPSNP